MEAWMLGLLFATGVAAGFVDSIAGGGGLITLPVLLSLGYAPQDALGTNKLQATFGSGSAAWHYARGKAVDLRQCGLGFAAAFAGSGIGTLVVQQVSSVFLQRAIPILLLAVAIYVFVKPDLGREDRIPYLSSGVFHLLFGVGLGFYDGFFGPGTGTFWAVAYVFGLGFNLTRATAHTKVMNFASNLSSLIFFAAGGRVVLMAGLVMGLGQWLGARLGSGMVLSRGTRFIRPVFLAVVVALTLKLLVQYW